MIRKKKRWHSYLIPVLFLILLFWATRFTDCDLPAFWKRKSHLTDLVFNMFPPDLSYLPRILAPLFATVQMSVTGTVLGSFLALILAPFGAKFLGFPDPLTRLLRILIQILRSFPALILALAATFLFGLGTFAGTAAITVYTFAIMTRLTYEDLETAESGPYEALCAMGAARYPACFRAVMPEIFPSFLANALYLLETNVRHSSILGYVGAGGIGLLLNEKMSWLEYDKVGTILILLFLTVCMIETASRFLSSVIRKERILSKKAERILALAFTALFVFCTLTVASPDFSRTSPAALKNMAMGFLAPDWSFFFSAGKDGLGYLLLETVCISLVGTVAGAIIAASLSFLNTKRFAPPAVSALFNLLIMAIRSVPFFIYGLIFIRVSGPGAFTGVLTLAVCSIGLLTKRFTESLDSLDLRPYRALAAMGVSPVVCIFRAVLPQLKPAFLSAVLYRFDVNIREASVLGLVGAGGIGAPLIFAMNQYAWKKAGAIALGLILLVWLIDSVSSRLRQKLL